jgi:phosphonate transport system substrate-binding protein
MKMTALIRMIFFCGFSGTVILWVGCNSTKDKYEPSYSLDSSSKNFLLFGVPTQSYYEITDLFVNYLNQNLKEVQLKTVASSSFSGYNEKLDQGYFDVTIVNGMVALRLAEKDYSIIGRAMDKSGNSGVILVNKDSSINSFSDLKGKTIVTPGPPALPGHMLQMLFLNKKGLDVNKDFQLSTCESFESVFLNLYLGKASAGFSTTTSWNIFLKRRPEIASKVQVKWQTQAIIGNALVFRKSLNKQTASRLASLILSMDKTEAGKKALEKIGYLRFEPATSSSFEPLRDVIKEYNSLVGQQ